MSTTKKNPENTKKPMGRPRRFDRDDALEKAMNVFCVNGYQGTSISQLTDAMSMNPPSLYGAFGDKERLFIDALDYYHAPFKEAVTEIFDHSKNTYEAFEALFKLSETSHTQPNATGCLIVNSSINTGTESTKIAEKIKALHDMNENMLYKRLKKGQVQGDIPNDIQLRSVARYVNGILQGAAVVARGQQSPKAVKDLLEQGLKGFKALTKM